MIKSFYKSYVFWLTLAAFIFGVFLPIDVSIWIDIIKSWFRKTIPADGKDDGN